MKSVFVIRAALWAEKLGRCIETCRSWKNTLGKLVVAVNLEAIWFEFWIGKELRVTVEIFVFCSSWYSNQFDIVSKTNFSFDTVGRELLLAVPRFCTLKWTGSNIRIGGYVFCVYFTDFKKWCFDVSFLTPISVTTNTLTLQNLNF